MAEATNPQDMTTEAMLKELEALTGRSFVLDFGPLNKWLTEEQLKEIRAADPDQARSTIWMMLVAAREAKANVAASLCAMVKDLDQKRATPADSDSKLSVEFHGERGVCVTLRCRDPRGEYHELFSPADDLMSIRRTGAGDGRAWLKPDGADVVALAQGLIDEFLPRPPG